ADLAATLPGSDLPRTAAPVPAAPTLADFPQCIDELVRIGQRTAALAQQDDQSAAIASDQEARTQFSTLLDRFPDAGERSLAMLIELPAAKPADASLAAVEPRASGVDPLSHGRQIVLQLVLRAECERRDAAAEAAHDHSRIDALVQSVLDVMPGTTHTTEVGAFVLIKQRFLRARHEESVLGLVKLAATERFPRDVATQLLLTLWDNLQTYGERSSDEMSRLALLLLGDGDPSQRAAACRQLMRDARYRTFVLAMLRERGDRPVATGIAMMAASELPPADALDVLRELAPVVPTLTGPYLTLGFRAPDAVADRYRELLASNTQPGIRKDMVTGIGVAHTPLGLEVAQLALDNDPSVDVRVQAVFALTSRADSDIGERALTKALDDPQVAQDSVRLGALVGALQNLETAGQTNAVDRLGQRFRLLPLLESDRRKLDAILARSLPGGQSALPAPGR
ncbi:MAG: hypothetical protein WBO45_25485, partial [Planctomycetota bacterium]